MCVTAKEYSLKTATQQTRTDTTTAKPWQSTVTWNVALRTLPNGRGKEEKPVFHPSWALTAPCVMSSKIKESHGHCVTVRLHYVRLFFASLCTEFASRVLLPFHFKRLIGDFSKGPHSLAALYTADINLETSARHQHQHIPVTKLNAASLLEGSNGSWESGICPEALCKHIC